MAQENKNNNHRQLAALLSGLSVHGLIPQVYPRGICLHSKYVTTGDVFFAYEGEVKHGVNYIEDAVKRGAAAVVTDAKVEVAECQKQFPQVPILGVVSLKENLSLIAARFYRTVNIDVDVIGITGTNGKTTCSHFLAQAYQHQQRACYVIGTLGHGFYPLLQSSALTTPDAIEVQALLAHAQQHAANAIVMEVSSHALQQYRVEAAAFKLAIFTNLSRDHLDYHGDMEKYFAAKQRLFHFPGLKNVVLNADDPASERLAEGLTRDVNLCWYSINPACKQADIHATIGLHEQKGIRFKVKSIWGEAELTGQFIGNFNISNLLAMMASLMCLGWTWTSVINVTRRIHTIPGRLEQLGGGEFPLAIIDYAHTPDALENALSAVIAHRGKHGRIIVVFGCGGNRDQGKRAKMGQIAERLADTIVLTDDNPRHEDAQAILADILKGVRTQQRVHVEHDRALAIRYALIDLAKRNDLVLIAGKGHEDYQLVGGQRLHFSDKEQVQQCLQELAA